MTVNREIKKTKGIFSKMMRSVDHYENFPVASFVIPPYLRKPIISIYNFARLADDIADEGQSTASERLHLLNILDACLKNEDLNKYVRNDRLSQKQDIIQVTNMAKKTLVDYCVDISLATQLLKAFKYDADFEPFSKWSDLENYCKNSANPIGQILLNLFNYPNIYDTESQFFIKLIHYSDAVCTGLQIINFAQDAATDISNDRINYPKEIWPSNVKSGLPKEFLNLSQEKKNKLTQMMTFTGKEKLTYGKNLPALLLHSEMKNKFRFALEISLTIECGLFIAKCLLTNPYAVWKTPPKVSLFQIPLIIISSLHCLTSRRKDNL